jgi:hypothetical protein
MRARLHHLLLLAPLALAAAAPVPHTAQAAGKIPAGLELTHYAPVNGKVSAQMIGKSFWPKERVRVTYRVSVPKVFSRTYTFDATTDRFGAFYRTVRFNLGKPAYGYTIKATAVGRHGDRATLSTWASGQSH